ncbi:MAG: sigma-70 family RNA polymerase sigma factor [Planctomycetota bacterium]|nr:sigma-70 family RNA polymerase sigma factor [Planctomycetota bacterium]
MSADPEEFERLLAAIRDGDSSACSAFVGTFRPVVNNLANGLFSGNRLQGPYDQSDIAQSVVFKALEIVKGGYPIHGPPAFHSLLKIMVTRKIIGLSRKPENRVRSVSREHFEQQLSLAVESDKSTSELIADTLDLNTIVALMTPENQRVFELLCQGKSFVEIGVLLGKKPHAVGVSYKRDLSRISRMLDPDDSTP